MPFSRTLHRQPAPQHPDWGLSSRLNIRFLLSKIWRMEKLSGNCLRQREQGADPPGEEGRRRLTVTLHNLSLIHLNLRGPPSHQGIDINNICKLTSLQEVTPDECWDWCRADHDWQDLNVTAGCTNTESSSTASRILKRLFWNTECFSTTTFWKDYCG